MKVHIITIGDEILIGQIVDTNSAWLSTQLNLCGIEVTEIKTIGDQHDHIQNALDTSLKKADVVLLTGGLGATNDDITKKALANYFGVELQLDEELYFKVVSWFNERNIPVTDAVHEQCQMPQNMLHLENKMGTAPGMWFEYEDAVIVAMPGIPYEMKHVMTEKVLPRLKERADVAPICHKTLLTAGYGEVQLAKKIEPVLETFPDNIKMAYLPNLGEVRLRISAYGEAQGDVVSLQQQVEKKAVAIRDILGNTIYGYEKDDIQSALGRILSEKGLTVATAESCTGGSVAAKIVQVSGASEYFKGGVIAYNNDVKKQELGVTSETLERHGAVSEATVKEMVSGVIRKLNADVAVAVSGIVGPTGGTEEKPVGLIWIAVGDKDKVEAHELRLSKNRLQNIEYTSKRALNLLRLFLLNKEVV